jgi:hypothetical protein
VEDCVERGAVGAHPRPDGRAPPRDAIRPLGTGRVDVNAADDVVGVGVGVEHGVSEPAAPGEVLCVPFKVAEIVVQRHLVGPATPTESWCRADMADAGRPGGVIGLVMLRAERGQPELPGREPVRDREVFRDEQFTAHLAMVTPCGGRCRPADPARGGRA